MVVVVVVGVAKLRLRHIQLAGVDIDEDVEAAQRHFVQQRLLELLQLAEDFGAALRVGRCGKLGHQRVEVRRGVEHLAEVVVRGGVLAVVLFIGEGGERLEREIVIADGEQLFRGTSLELGHIHLHADFFPAVGDGFHQADGRGVARIA